MEGVRQKELASLLGLTTRQIRNLENAGVLQPKLNARGQKIYPWPESNQSYLRYKIEEAKGKRTSAQQSIEEAELREALADAELKEIRLAKEKGELIHVDDVEKMVREPLEAVAALIKALPNRWASLLVGMKTPQEVIAQLRPAVAEITDELRGLGEEIEGGGEDEIEEDES